MQFEEKLENDYLENKNFSWLSLRSQFRQQNLEDLFELYVEKVQHGYFSLFLILQCMLCVTHVIVLLLAAGTSPQHLQSIVPDAVCYTVVALVSAGSLLLKENSGRACVHHALGGSFLAVGVLVACNFFVPLYHYQYGDIRLRPAYSVHTVIVCYVFLPIPNNVQAFLLGVAVTFCHLLTLALLTYRHLMFTMSSTFIYNLTADAIFMLCINGMGLYFRFINEILKRITFLDHRACVQSTLYLKHEEDQEEQLMLSILPQHVVERVREDIKKTLHYLEGNNMIPGFKTFRNMYVERHDNVTILYADIVRYTEMTRRLTVIRLVETLNDLFSKFDVASMERDVLRIKFLGDCYYCVSGVPISTPRHAVNCVELGLDMIAIIQEVRRKRNLNIDMRIGVHSGSIWGGLIGKCKWQYDIWSEDVDIANRMEQRGQPGKVHVTYQTLVLLDSKYDYVESNAAVQDDFLHRLDIQTFLILPKQDEPRFSVNEVSNIFNRKQSVSVNRNYTRPNPSGNGTAIISHRRTAFMTHNLKEHRRINEIEKKLEEAILKLPLRKFEQWFHSPGINPFLLTFRNLQMEWPYFVLADPLFKYYLLSSVCVLIAIFILHNFMSFQLDQSVVLMYITLAILLVVFIPFTWLRCLRKKQTDHSESMSCLREIIHCLFEPVAVAIANSTIVRTFIYVTVSILIAACTILDVVQCIENVHSNDAIAANPYLYCRTPWRMTETCSLAIVASFLFLRIHLGVKLALGAVVTCVFSYYISRVPFLEPDTWNPHLHSDVACIVSIAFLTLTLHFVDRQGEYLNRLDYQWKTQLTLEKKEAQTMHGINILLLQNILPVHVVQIYLDTNRSDDELYHEHYKDVAVMFASVVDHDFSKEDLDADISPSTIEIMNEIISEFDKLLLEPCGEKIEKIKVAGWTYMAACGLDRSGVQAGGRRNRSSSRSNIVVQLVCFGVRMMTALEQITGSFASFRLRVGIAHGEVTAGVVGARKPMYDVWGDTVNMASRMDSTGEKGRIQVTQATARLLQRHGIACTYRGDTFIKGLNAHIPTYFVDVDTLTYHCSF